MGFRFRRSIKLMPGVRMNVSGRGASLSLDGRGATLNISSRGTRATVGLPGMGLSYTTSVGASPPRRRSAQQIAAAHRRMLKEAAHAAALQEVERIEAELAEMLSAWRELPAVPTASDYQRALALRPFECAEPPPTPPDWAEAQREHRLAVQQAAFAEHGQGLWERNMWLLTTLGCVALMTPFDVALALQAGLSVGAVTWVAVFAWWRSRLRPICLQRAEAEWPARHRELDLAHGRAVDEHGKRAVVARARWTTAEQRRTADLQKLLQGDLETISAAAIAAVEELDFPFEAMCDVAVDDDDHVLVDLDLPEIEDVVPETQLRALKDGSVTEKKRKAADRNQKYAELVCGIALAIAATVHAAAPSLASVTIAGRTQRKKRVAGRVEDEYVYEVKVPRALFARCDPRTIEPVETLGRLGARMQINANGSMRAIAPPTWASADAAE